jgi:competence protein ComEC
MTLVYLTLGWVAGLVVADRYAPESGLAIGLAVISLTGLALYYRDVTLRVMFGAGLLLSLGILRFDAVRPADDPQHVLHLNDRGDLLLRGVVIAEPEVRDNGLRILIDAEEAAGRPVSGRVLATVPRVSDVHYGDEVTVFGRLLSPPEFDTFSYRDYLARQQVYSLMFNADIEVLAEDQGFPPYAALLNLKDEARAFIQKSLPEPQASLLVGILLGDESGISEDTRQSFTRTGASHIIAISGFNMVILAGIVMGVLRRFMKDRRAAIIGIIVIVIYTIFVGAGGAVVRAAIMSGMLIWGQAMHRKTFVPASLAFTVIVMSALDPFALWDIGFQLSFAAVMGMALFVEPIEKWINRGLARLASDQTRQAVLGALSESFIVTTAAQITTTPLILFYFGRLSVVSLPVNLLIIPAQTPLLLFGAVGTAVGLLIPALGDLILSVSSLFLTWSVEVVEFFAGLSWADRELALGEGSIMVFFAMLFLIMSYQATQPRWAISLMQRTKIPTWAALSAGLIVLLLLGNTIRQKPDGRLHLTFLDVGGANSVLIETPRGGVFLVDGGPFPTRLLDQMGDTLPGGTRHIDALILTSAQQDHIAALPEVASRYEIGALLTNGETSDAPEYAALLERLAVDETPVTPLTAGYTLNVDDGVEITILSAQGGLVLRLTYGEAVFLLTGDIQNDVEQLLLANPHVVQATVLQVADHGSGEASGVRFIETVSPQAAVIQVEAGNLANDPSPTVLDRLSGATIFRTDQHGVVEFVTDGHTLDILAEESPP